MIKHVTVAMALLAAPAVVLSGCSNQSSDNGSTSTTSSTSGSASSGQNLTTQLKSADGEDVADATIDFTSGYATVTVETKNGGLLSPGFHGLHIHAVGKCEGDFTSAGEHLQAPGSTTQPASGDLPPLLVRSDGSGKLVATSDAFTADDLKGPEGSAIVLHEGSYMAGAPSSEQRVACGVLSPASQSSTSVSTSTSTVTTTVGAPVPPDTATPTPAPEMTSPSAATSTPSSTQTTVPTTTAPTVTTTTPVPAPNG
ncbi:superoxide dismutase [Mycobacterium sp. ITM-2017-0098]|nr:superoxide dismutase [Mycobacterium sp. ITM-2017-0098]